MVSVVLAALACVQASSARHRGLVEQVNECFHFLADGTEEEARLRLCDPRDSYEVSQLIDSLGD